MGGSESSTSTDKSTRITSTTETNIRDIGLTGAAGVELASVLEQGVVAQTLALNRIVEPIVQAAGQGYKQLKGGAGDLVVTGPSGEVADTGDGIKTTLSANAPLIITAIAAVAFLAKAKG